jgi:UDP-N-acetyl-D-glucosamine/UDP-N-acetyl-D-galactosamine dehydrogenase
MNLSNLKVAVIGMGYVGLPLAVEFAKVRKIIGFDIKQKRILELKKGIDLTFEIKKKFILKNKNIYFTNNINDLKNINCYIIAVPTPINKNKTPDLRYFLNATTLVASVLKKNDIVIYESTVYPGCTENKCVPILQKKSGLKYNTDFYCGYSPERINPGDKNHRIQNIKKITSGSNPKVAKLIDKLYKQIILSGTHSAKSIIIAEAAKVIENIQRDLNIALVNELSILFKKMSIDTHSVLKAAETKWNFHPYKPGLVGGHCIGVDPYYLTYIAKKFNHNPKIILSGRSLNENMGKYVAQEFKKEMKKKLINISKSKILIMGLTFKENCPDLRNSGVKKVVEELKKLKCQIDLYDPWPSKSDIYKYYRIKPIKKLYKKKYDGIIVSVAHKKFKELGEKFIFSLCKNKSVIYDLKNIFNSKKINLKL